MWDSQGWVDNHEMIWNPKCELVCDDPKFDEYIKNEIKYSPKYSVLAYKWFPYYWFGYRNCQSWAREVIRKAYNKYEKNEKCNKCYGMSRY